MIVRWVSLSSSYAVNSGSDGSIEGSPPPSTSAGDVNGHLFLPICGR
jgi:hypothetical protein